MSSVATATPDVSFRKCSFCGEEILSDAKKCKHCGEFLNEKLSMGIGAVFAAGVIIACLMARTGEGVMQVGVWAIFTLLFARTFGRR
jgi:hypothetical protein